MISVTIYCNGEGRIYRYTVRGHAESVDEGFDPVCALVSLATQSPILGLERYLKRRLRVSVDKEAGSLEVILEEADEETEAILRTMLYTLEDLKKSDPHYLRTKKLRR